MEAVKLPTPNTYAIRYHQTSLGIRKLLTEKVG